MIETDEKIIDCLEEIDMTFFLINRTLREIKTKVEDISKVNNKIVSDCKPWLDLFGIGEKMEVNDIEAISRNTEPSIVIESNIDAASLKCSSPSNPFLDDSFVSNEWLNKMENKYNKVSDSSIIGEVSILNKSYNNINNVSDFTNDESINIEQSIKNKHLIEESIFESSEGEIETIPFNINDLPSIFVDDPLLKHIYDIINESGTISMDKIYSSNPGITSEKINLFVELLIRKRFIKNRNGILSTK
ncbi:hypothetical protein TCON_1107 [Astathelohania contejeani]|uniref:Outer kinetochore protein ASK1 n=1 Tax=Astathelohania contejeani TaxID=164912 RepID=A0ABQ7HZQ2_9MICR|nr:hypothetical protein TCON_1107 [Thelohania contejeani]